MTSLDTEIAPVLDALCQRWNTLALPTIEQLWDPDEATP